MKCSGCQYGTGDQPLISTVSARDEWPSPGEPEDSRPKLHPRLPTSQDTLFGNLQ